MLNIGSGETFIGRNEQQNVTEIGYKIILRLDIIYVDFVSGLDHKESIEEENIQLCTHASTPFIPGE